MAEVGFPYQDGGQRDFPWEQKHQLDQLRSTRGQSDLGFRPPKHSQSQSQN